MEVAERVEQLEQQLKMFHPELHLPSTATLEHRVRWLEIVFKEMKAGDNHGMLGNTIYIRPDRITLHSLTADPASVVAGDVWFRSDFGRVKLAIDGVATNARGLLFQGEGAEFVAGDMFLQSADLEGYHTNLTWTKVKEIVIKNAGVLRIKFDLRDRLGGYGVSGQIYKNGTAVGTVRTTTSGTYNTYTEDVSGWVAGDLVQLYTKGNVTNGQPQHRNFRLYTNYLPTAVVNLD